MAFFEGSPWCNHDKHTQHEPCRTPDLNPPLTCTRPYSKDGRNSFNSKRLRHCRSATTILFSTWVITCWRRRCSLGCWIISWWTRRPINRLRFGRLPRRRSFPRLGKLIATYRGTHSPSLTSRLRHLTISSLRRSGVDHRLLSVNRFRKHSTNQTSATCTH